MRPDRRLGLNAAAHLLVDGLCAATVFGRISSAENLPMLILVYNTLAFSTQCLVGLEADRLKSDRIAAAVSMVCIVLGYALPVPGWARVGLIGLGNSVFHVAGGRMTLLQRIRKPGRRPTAISKARITTCSPVLTPSPRQRSPA